LSDEMFAARHLRYEIYEKKQIQPLLGQRRRSRSNRSESEHSQTASANPRSPDIGSEAVGESVFAYPTSEDAPVHSDAVGYRLPEQTALPTVDVRLCRMSSSTLAALTQTPSLGTEAVHIDTRTPLGDVCKGSSWPTRSFPLVDADYDRLLVVNSSSDSCCHPCTAVSASPMVSVGSGVPPSEAIVTESIATDCTSDIQQSNVPGMPSASIAPVTTL